MDKQDAKPKHRVFIKVIPIRKPEDGPIEMIEVQILAGPPHIEDPSLLNCDMLGKGVHFVPARSTEGFAPWQINDALDKALVDAVRTMRVDERLFLALRRALKACKRMTWDSLLKSRREPFVVHGEDDASPSLAEHVSLIRDLVRERAEEESKLPSDEADAPTHEYAHAAYSEVELALSFAIDNHAQARQRIAEEGA